MTNYYIQFFAVLLYGIFTLNSEISYGQTVADTLTLDELEVTATRIHQPLQLQPTGITIIDSTSLTLHIPQNLGEVLSNSSTIFIKGNGPGGLSTASQRGLSAEQIQILWEGIPINNGMLGLTDLSLLPASLFSSVQLSSGTPSTAFGGGSLSGSIYLDSDPQEGNRLSFRQGSGSYGQWQSALNGSYKSGNWQAGVRSVASWAKNDFKYYNRAYDRYEYRDHNRQKQENMMADIGYKSGVKRFESKFWVSNSTNDIPGSILKTNSRARQDDKAIRWLSTYQTHWQGAEITFKNYLERITLNYFDPQIDTRSFSTNRRWLTSASISMPISSQFLMKGEVSGGLTGAETNNYTGLKTRQHFSALVNPELSFVRHRFRLYPALRFDSYNDFGNVISPSLGVNYEIFSDKLYLRGQLSRDFNPPTFNALYWAQGGVSTLQPERSNKAEAGAVYNPRWNTFSTIKLTAFYSRVNNGIRWYPGNNNIYSPENIDQITSKGLEASLKNELRLSSQWHLNIEQSANFISAEITEPRFAGDAGVGHQLRYVPKWNYRSSLSVQKGIVTGLLQYHWTSRRYYTATEDYGNSLDPYGLLDATIQLQKQFLGLNFIARGGMRNLLDANYEIVQWYAMPQRNIHFSLTATYQF